MSRKAKTNKTVKTPKTSKTVKARTGRTGKRTDRPRTHVVSFRITDDQLQMLAQILDRDKATNVTSTNQWARKLVVDYINGRTAYKDPKDKKADLDTVTPV